MNNVFGSILGTESTAASLDAAAFLACSLCSLLLGLAIAFIYMYRHDYSKSFVVTLALLPIIVQMVIALVNGNLGAGIAVMGVFNLVRFRSVPGSAKDICAVFLAMAVGLATGMGFLALAVLFTLIVGLANFVFVASPLGKPAAMGVDKTLKVSIPEDLDYCSIFDDLFARFTRSAELVNVRTTNMGSLYQLEYRIRLLDPKMEKALLDAIRCRNGNLSVQCGRPISSQNVL